jgi:hypothetical protein
MFAGAVEKSKELGAQFKKVKLFDKINY